MTSNISLPVEVCWSWVRSAIASTGWAFNDGQITPGELLAFSGRSAEMLEVDRNTETKDW